MKSINKIKTRLDYSGDGIDVNGKRGYYFHADEDFREDPEWKHKSPDLSKINNATSKRQLNR